jgi:hypothetical protein
MILAFELKDGVMVIDPLEHPALHDLSRLKEQG